MIGVSAWLPQERTKRYGTGSVPVADASAYESKEAALAMLADAQDRIVRAIQALDDATVDQPTIVAGNCSRLVHNTRRARSANLTQSIQ